MADQPTSRYDTSVKVKQEVIDRIKSMGMKAAVDAANKGGENAEFVEGAKRMYGGRVGAQNAPNLAKAQQTTKATGRAAPSVGDVTSAPPTGGSKSVPMPASAPAAAARATAPKPPIPGLSPANVKGLNTATDAVESVKNKLGGGPSLGQQNAGTATANILKGIFGGIKGAYRKQTHQREK